MKMHATPDHDRQPGLGRRQFLQSTLAGMALAAVPQLLNASEPSSFSLGFSLYGMQTLPLDEALNACARIGYSHVEMSLIPGSPTEPKVFTREAREAAAHGIKAHKLSLPCLMINISLTADEKAHAESLKIIGDAGALAHELVPANPPFLETVLGGKPELWDKQKAGMVDKLHSWAEAAEKAKTMIAIKAHIMSAVNSPARLLWLFDQVKSPAIQLAYDYSHFELQGIDMEDSLRTLLPHTRFIHVKDSIGAAEKFRFVLPGEGRTDYVKYFSLLKSLGYRGPVCVEASRQVWSVPGYDPIVAAEKCYATLAKAQQEAGRGK